MRIKISPITASKAIYFDALFVMVLCIWWAWSTGNQGITLIGFFAGVGLMDLSARAEGKKYLDGMMLFIVWSMIVVFVVAIVLASLGNPDVFGLVHSSR